jgi:hypothetical protein
MYGHESDLHQSLLPGKLLARFAALNHLYVTVALESDAGLRDRLTMAVDLRLKEMHALGAAYDASTGAAGGGDDWVGSLSTRIDRSAGLARTLARAEQLLQELLDRAIEPITGGHPAYGQLVRSYEASVRWRNDLVFRGLNADPAGALAQTVDDVFRPRCLHRHQSGPFSYRGG